MLSKEDLERHMQCKINLRDERIRVLEQQVEKLEADKLELVSGIEEWKHETITKAVAWDNLEALVDLMDANKFIEIDNWQLDLGTKLNGQVSYQFSERSKNLKEAVSNALTAIKKGES